MKRIYTRMAIAASTLALVILVSSLSILLCAIYVPFDYYWALGLGLTFLTIGGAVGILSYFYFRIKGFHDTGDLKLESIYGPQVSKAFTRAGVGILIADRQGIVTYQSDYLTRCGFHALERSVQDLNSELADRYTKALNGLDQPSSFDNFSSDFEITCYDRIFSVEMIPQAGVFILKDLSLLKRTQQSYESDSPFVAFLRVDDYDDKQTSLGEVAMTRTMNKLRDLLFDISGDKYFISSISEDTYIIMGKRKDMLPLSGDELELVSRVRGLGDSSLTVSVGIALEFPDLASACEVAFRNMEGAGEKGGDQAMVTTYPGTNKSLGGKTESRASINRAQIRNRAAELYRVIGDSDLVLTLGHIDSDFDSIGSCLGIWQICQTLGVKCRIVYSPENTEKECRKAFEEYYGDKLDDMTINFSDALDCIDSRTLIVLVDVTNPDRMVYPNFISFDSSARVAVIDHHRIEEIRYKNLVFKGSESSASSACELLAEYIENAPKPTTLDSRIATLMLAGTMVDTTRFRSKVSEPTYKAMAYLMSCGGSTDIAASLTREDYGQFQTKIRFLKGAEYPRANICVAVDPDRSEVVDRTMLSLVANQAMTISGIDAAFAIGNLGESMVGVSARSNTRFNVEAVMKQMHGGGHFSAAATAISNTTIPEVRKMLLDILSEMDTDSRETRRTDNRRRTLS